MLQDFIAVERLALTHTRPVRIACTQAGLGGAYEIVASHASYNELCFVEHVLGETEEMAWNDSVAMWIELRAEGVS